MIYYIKFGKNTNIRIANVHYDMPTASFSRRDALYVLGSASFAGCTRSLLEDSSSDPMIVEKDVSEPARVKATWPQYRYDARNTANPDAAGPGTAPAWYWSYEPDSQDVRFTSPATLGSDRLVVPDYFEQSLVALDPESGSETVPITLPDPVEFVPAIDGDTLYAQAGMAVVAVDLASGGVRWTADLSGKPGPPTITDSTVYVGIAEGNTATYALDAETGEKRWRVETGLVTTAPAVADETVVVGDWHGTVRALAATDGSERWSQTVREDWVQAAPVVEDGRVYACSGTRQFERGQAVAFDLDGGGRLWSRTFETAVSRSPALANGRLYVPDFHGSIHALDADDGSESWSFSPADDSAGQTAQAVDFSPAVGRETMYYGGPDRRVHAVDAATGEQRWRTAGERELVLAPILAGEYLFVGDERSMRVIGPG